MGDGLDFMDIARSLIQPGHNSFQRPQSNQARRLPDHSSIPAAKSVDNGQTVSPSPAPSNERTSELRAQLLATRRMTPDNTKASQSSENKTSQSASVPPNNEPSARSLSSRPNTANPDVDNLLASISAPVPQKDYATRNGASSANAGGGNSGRRHAQIDEPLVGGQDPENTQQSSLSKNERPTLSHQSSPKKPEHGGQHVPHAAQRRDSLKSNSGGAGLERMRAEQDRIERDRAATARKAKKTSTIPRQNPVDSNKRVETETDRADQLDANGTPTSQDHKTTDMRTRQTERPTMEDFDVATVPVEVAQWLELHRFWDETHRAKVLTRENKRAELERQLRELDQEGLEDGVRVVRASHGPPVQSVVSDTHRPPSSSVVRTFR